MGPDELADRLSSRLFGFTKVRPYLDAITLVDGNDGNHASDPNLNSRAVDQLAGGHQIIKQNAQALAGVHSERIYSALYLQECHACDVLSAAHVLSHMQMLTMDHTLRG